MTGPDDEVVWVATAEPYHDNSTLIGVRRDRNSAIGACEEHATSAGQKIFWSRDASGSAWGATGTGDDYVVVSAVLP